MQRKKHSAEFKAKIALEAAKGLKTINEIAGEAEVHPTQVSLWKKQLLDEMPSLFASGRGQQEKKEEDLTATLYQQIGQLNVELDWMKKNLVLAVAEKKELIEPTHRSISIARYWFRLMWKQKPSIARVTTLVKRTLYGSNLT